MNRDSSIIPKIIVILGFLSVIGIILLFFRPRWAPTETKSKPETTEELFAQVISAAQPKLLRVWEEGDRYIKKDGVKCDDEILLNKKVGRSYYQCQPHFWQCYWEGKVKRDPSVKVDLFGQTYHVRAKSSFQPIQSYSAQSRYYQIVKGPYRGLDFNYGVLAELLVDEIPGFVWPIILTDTCRDVYLPQRIYGYGPDDKGFIWDNFDRKIFIDKFYVSNQQVNEWRLLTKKTSSMVKDRNLWPQPAMLDLTEQRAYCAFWGKRVLEAALFDAATMTPIDLKDTMEDKIMRPDTPWQRDLSKTFLGMARINPDYQLTPLDCQLAQVEGCAERFFTTDSVTWSGINYALGFYPESLINLLEPEKNLKTSSRFLPANSESHQLGKRTNWDGRVNPDKPIAFRCYEEVSP